jgi:hypothetical protein
MGFYNSGQLFLEEYYTLSIIVHAGLGTNNLDGNTAPLHGDRRAGFQGVVRLRRPAGLLYGLRRVRLPPALRAQHGLHADRRLHLPRRAEQAPAGVARRGRSNTARRTRSSCRSDSFRAAPLNRARSQTEFYPAGASALFEDGAKPLLKPLHHPLQSAPGISPDRGSA